MSTTPDAVGIDLGFSTFATACVGPQGHPTMCPSEEGGAFSPSVLLFDDDEILAGKIASSAAATDPDRVLRWFNRQFGTTACRQQLNGKQISPVTTAAFLLRAATNTLRPSIQEPLPAVLALSGTLPPLARQSMLQASAVANLQLLSLIDSASAIAIAYAEQHGYLGKEAQEKEEATALLVDLGGGTLDVGIFNLGTNKVETLALGGDSSLGGIDWDARIIVMLADGFQKECHLDPRKDPGAVARLHTTATEVKLALGARSKATGRVDFKGMSCEVEITRETLITQTSDLMNRLQKAINQTLEKAKLEWSHITHVVLTGGASRMPQIGNLLKQLSGKEPDKSLNPEQAVASGAAYYAQQIVGQYAGEDAIFAFTPATAYPICGVQHTEDESRAENLLFEAVPAGSTLPAEFSKKFVTGIAEQERINFSLFACSPEELEESPPEPFYQLTAFDLPVSAPGFPIEVVFHVDPHGLFSAEVQQPGSGRSMDYNFVLAGTMPESELQGWRDLFVPEEEGASCEFGLEQVLSRLAPATMPNPSGQSIAYQVGTATAYLPQSDLAPATQQTDQVQSEQKQVAPNNAQPATPKEEGAKPQIRFADKKSGKKKKRSGDKSEPEIADGSLLAWVVIAAFGAVGLFVGWIFLKILGW